MVEKIGLYEVNVYDSEWELNVYYDKNNPNEKNAIDEVYKLFNLIAKDSAEFEDKFIKIMDILKTNQIKYEWVMVEQ